MPQTSHRSAFRQGLIAGAPHMLVVVPFGVLFGVVATEAGFPVDQVMGFSILVIAGASQFTAVQLMTENAPTIIVLASALAVNLRMAMYSAALTPHLGTLPYWKRGLIAYFMVDQTYAVSALKYDEEPGMTTAEKMAYFSGTVVLICPQWYVSTYAGIYLGEVIPASLPIDFAIPITFLAIIAPGLRTLAHVAAAVTAVIASLALVAVPFNLGVLIAALIAIVVGARVELWENRKRAAT